MHQKSRTHHFDVKIQKIFWGGDTLPHPSAPQFSSRVVGARPVPPNWYLGPPGYAPICTPDATYKLRNHDRGRWVLCIDCGLPVLLLSRRPKQTVLCNHKCAFIHILNSTHAPATPCTKQRTFRQGRLLLHWSMDAACVLEKTRGKRKSCIFSWKLGGRIIKGEERLKLLKHIFALLSSYFLKNFLARSARSITFYFHPPITVRGSYTSAFKSGTEKRRFSVPLLMTWCHQIDHTKSKLNIELYTLSCTGRQSCREQDN